MIQKFSLLILATVLSLSSLGVESTVAQQTTSRNVFSFKGRVVNSATRQPIPGAVVTYGKSYSYVATGPLGTLQPEGANTNGNAKTVTADAQGNFSFSVTILQTGSSIPFTTGTNLKVGGANYRASIVPTGFAVRDQLKDIGEIGLNPGVPINLEGTIEYSDSLLVTAMEQWQPHILIESSDGLVGFSAQASRPNQNKMTYSVADLPDGEYTAFFRWRSGDGSSFGKDFVIANFDTSSVAANTGVLKVASAISRVSGKVLLPDESGTLSSAAIQTVTSKFNVTSRLYSLDAGGLVDLLTTNTDGKYDIFIGHEKNKPTAVSVRYPAPGYYSPPGTKPVQALSDFTPDPTKLNSLNITTRYIDPSTAPKTAVIKGETIDGLTKAALPGVQVFRQLNHHYQSTLELVATTDATGSYAITGAAEGQPYTLIFRSPTHMSTYTSFASLKAGDNQADTISMYVGAKSKISGTGPKNTRVILKKDSLVLATGYANSVTGQYSIPDIPTVLNESYRIYFIENEMFDNGVKESWLQSGSLPSQFAYIKFTQPGQELTRNYETQEFYGRVYNAGSNNQSRVPLAGAIIYNASDTDFPPVPLRGGYGRMISFGSGTTNPNEVAYSISQTDRFSAGVFFATILNDTSKPIIINAKSTGDFIWHSGSKTITSPPLSTYTYSSGNYLSIDVNPVPITAPANTLTGVITRNNQPVAGVTVRALNFSRSSQGSGFKEFVDITDSQGRYHFAGLNQDGMLLAVASPNNTRQSIFPANGIGYLPIEFAGPANSSFYNTWRGEAFPTTQDLVRYFKPVRGNATYSGITNFAYNKKHVVETVFTRGYGDNAEINLNLASNADLFDPASRKYTATVRAFEPGGTNPAALGKEIAGASVRILSTAATDQQALTANTAVEAGPADTSADEDGATTSASGTQATFKNLKPGPYTVTISKIGYANSTQQVYITGRNKIVIDAVLIPAGR